MRSVLVLLIVVACSSQPIAPELTASEPTPAAPTTTTTPGPVPSGGSFVEHLQASRVDPLPTLADGRPATFVGVLFDDRAVEADTLTGEVVRTISAVETGAIWRLSDGSSYLMASVGSEPAGGHMFWSNSDGEPITGENLIAGCCSGWYAEPAPTAPVIAVTSSYFEVTSRDRSLSWATFNGPISGFGTAPAWSWDLSLLFALSEGYGDESRHLAIAEIDHDWFYAVALPWWPDDVYPSGLAMAADGTLISFQRSVVHESVQGVVFNPDGSFVGEFLVEDGSDLHGIDPTGNFLIYVDNHGAVRWRDLYGDTGVLGYGFLMASW